LKKNLISVGALKAQDLRETLGEGVLKIFSGSLVILKGIQRNNLYYLRGSAVIETSVHLEDDSIRLWHIRFGHEKEVLESVAKQRLLEDASTAIWN